MSRLRGEGVQKVVKMSRRRLWMTPYEPHPYVDLYKSSLQRALLSYKRIKGVKRLLFERIRYVSTLSTHFIQM